MPQMPIFEKKGLNRKIKATTFGDEQGETEDWNKEPRRLYNIEGFRNISSTICLGYPDWIKRSNDNDKGISLIPIKATLFGDLKDAVCACPEQFARTECDRSSLAQSLQMSLLNAMP